MQAGLDNGTAQNSDIENTPPEIHGAKYRRRPPERVKSAAETALGSANRRKSHGFLNPVYFHNRDRTAWLGREDSNLRMTIAFATQPATILLRIDWNSGLNGALLW
jgi:hypothetical protein